MDNLRKKLSLNDFRSFLSQNNKLLKELYIDKDMTVHDICERFNIHFDNNIAKWFFRYLGPKGKGLGGARPNSGNKKGTQFCSDCKKVIGVNCQCNQ